MTFSTCSKTNFSLTNQIQNYWQARRAGGQHSRNEPYSTGACVQPQALALNNLTALPPMPPKTHEFQAAQSVSRGSTTITTAGISDVMVGLSSMPSDVLRNVCSHLSIGDLRSVRGTNRVLRQLAGEPELWSEKLRDAGIDLKSEEGHVGLIERGLRQLHLEHNLKIGKSQLRKIPYSKSPWHLSGYQLPVLGPSIDVGSEQLQRVQEFQRSARDVVAVSPDSTRVVRRSRARRLISIIDLSYGEPMTLCDLPYYGDVDFAAFSSDNATLAVGCSFGHIAEVWRINEVADNVKSRLVEVRSRRLNANESVRSVALSRDGCHMATLVGPYFIDSDSHPWQNTKNLFRDCFHIRLYDLRSPLESPPPTKLRCPRRLESYQLGFLPDNSALIACRLGWSWMVWDFVAPGMPRVPDGETALPFSR